MSKTGQSSSPLSSFVLGFIFCVLFPGFVTAIAPVSWVRFERNDGEVTATAKTCVFFFFPYKTSVVKPLVGVGDRFIQGQIQRREAGDPPNHQRRSEDEAFLVLRGTETNAEVPVSPVSIKRVTERVNGFLDDPEAKPLRLFVVANWKFSVIAGGLVSLLTLLYVVGVLLSIALGLKRMFNFGVGDT